MTKATIDYAVSEAKRFLSKAKLVKTKKSGEYEYLEISKETGALRRASMDLTRALSEMRKA